MKNFNKESLFAGKTKKVTTKNLGKITLKQLKAGTLMELNELRSGKSEEELKADSSLSSKIALLVVADSVVLESGETFTPEELLELPGSALMELFGLVEDITVLSGINIPKEAKNTSPNAQQTFTENLQ